MAEKCQNTQKAFGCLSCVVNTNLPPARYTGTQGNILALECKADASGYNYTWIPGWYSFPVGMVQSE